MQKLLHLGSPKCAPPEQFFAVSSEKTDFSKEWFHMKIFSIKFVIKKVLIFGLRWHLLLKNAHVPFLAPKNILIIIFGTHVVSKSVSSQNSFIFIF